MNVIHLDECFHGCMHAEINRMAFGTAGCSLLSAPLFFTFAALVRLQVLVTAGGGGGGNHGFGITAGFGGGGGWPSTGWCLWTSWWPGWTRPEQSGNSILHEHVWLKWCMRALASLPLSCTTGHAADPWQHPACVDMCVYTYMHDHACICVHMHAVACVNMHVSPKTCPGWGPGQRALPCSWQCCGPAWKSEKKAMHEDVPSQKCCQACSMKRTVSSGT